jgi:hypothetical protein
MRAAAIVVAVIVAAAAGEARAQQNPQAEQLFRNGVELAKQGKYAEACAKFEASQGLESNSSTLLNLASCREKNGQLATAWALFLRAASEARKNGDQSLVKIAIDFSNKLEPRLPFLTISVPDTSRVDGLTISLDGRVLAPAELNQGVPLDPGAHEVEGRAPGHEAWSTEITLVEAERRSVEVPRFKQITELAPPVDGARQRGPAAGPADEPRGMPTLRKAAIGAGAVGVVGLAAMTVFGLQARSVWNDAQDRGDDQLRRDAEDKAGLATIGGVVGIAGVAAGVTLWIVGKPRPGEARAAWAPLVTRDGFGVAFGGPF